MSLRTELLEVLTSETYAAPETPNLSYADAYGHACAASVTRQFTGVKEETGGLRLSSLGKPAVLQALSLPHIKAELVSDGLYAHECIGMRMREIFHRGDQYEALVLYILQMSGWHVASTQETVNYAGVEGHTDAVVINPAGAVVLLEIKTMSDVYFKQFVKRPNDDRGYVTQLAAYTSCLQIPSLWVCLNKLNHDVAVIEPDVLDFERALERARTIITRMSEVETFSDIQKQFNPPPGIAEVYRKQQTGKLLLHPSIKYSPYRHLFYNIYEEENGYGRQTEYIADVL